jgi:secernin
MGSDAVVARGRATVDGQTLFGQNLHGPSQLLPRVSLRPGRDFAPGELSGVPDVAVPQVRRTQTVFGLHAHGSSGYRVGLNGAKVVAGCLPLEVRLRDAQPGLTGPDLVRLVLERSHSACHAVDILAGLIDRHGQGGMVDEPGASDCDHAFLIADSREAILVETAGKHWVAQEIGEVRALVSARTIRQDWDHISHGLSDQLIQQGAWPADGSKIDFVGAIGDAPEQHPLAFNRWGRAMFLLQEQNGHIDSGVLRRLVRDHGEDIEGSWMPSIGQVSTGACRHAGKLAGSATQASFLACVSDEAEVSPIAWVAFGPPCRSVFFPVVLTGRMPEALLRSGPESLPEQLSRLQRRTAAKPELWPEMREEFDRLQGEFDQCTEEYLTAAVHSAGDPELLEREGHSLMEHCVTRYEAILAQTFEQGAPTLEFAPGA